MDQLEITESDVRESLISQAKRIGRIKLPKRGTTKPFSPGKLGQRQRAHLKELIRLREARARWLRGDFTLEELADARAMLERWRDELTAAAKKDTPLWKRAYNRLKFWEK